MIPGPCNSEGVARAGAGAVCMVLSKKAFVHLCHQTDRGVVQSYADNGTYPLSLVARSHPKVEGRPDLHRPATLLHLGDAVRPPETGGTICMVNMALSEGTLGKVGELVGARVGLGS